MVEEALASRDTGADGCVVINIETVLSQPEAGARSETPVPSAESPAAAK